MEAAYEAVINGKGLREASRMHNVPVETLRRRVSGSVAVGCKPGPATILSDEEEDLTVAQKGHVHYQFQHFQLSILNFLITNFQYWHFSLPNLNFLISDF